MRSAPPKSSVFGFRRGPCEWLGPERPKRSECWRTPDRRAFASRAFFLISKTVASQAGGQRVEIAHEPSLYLVGAALESNRLRLAWFVRFWWRDARAIRPSAPRKPI